MQRLEDCCKCQARLEYIARDWWGEPVGLFVSSYAHSRTCLLQWGRGVRGKKP